MLWQHKNQKKVNQKNNIVEEPKRIVLGVTGSIAAYKSAEIIRRLTKKGFKVSAVMTKEAEHFITPLTLSRLSGDKVYRDMFDGQGDSWDIGHISLADAADVLLIAPATANIISKIACGIADDLLTCIAMATKAKILIAPAMNENMYKNKIVVENCEKLKKHGVIFIGPIEGKLACGKTAIGHIADEDEIVEEVIRSLK